MNKPKNSNYRINNQLKNCKIRLVGENIQPGVYTFSQALKIADNLNLDLVEISKNDDTSICKVIDFEKFLYQKRQKEKEQKANTVKIDIKEIRFGPQTDKHDYEFKLNHAKEFLKSGNKVKAFVMFSGREINYKEQGEQLLHNFINDLSDISTVESDIRLEGKRLYLLLTPKKQ